MAKFCPNCGSENFTDIRDFNIMFKTFLNEFLPPSSTNIFF